MRKAITGEYKHYLIENVVKELEKSLEDYTRYKAVVIEIIEID